MGTAYQVIFDHRSGDPFNVDCWRWASPHAKTSPCIRCFGMNGGVRERCIETFDPDSQMVLLGDRFKVSIGSATKTESSSSPRRGSIRGQHLTYRFVDSHAGCVISSGRF